MSQVTILQPLRPKVSISAVSVPFTKLCRGLDPLGGDSSSRMRTSWRSLIVTQTRMAIVTAQGGHIPTSGTERQRRSGTDTYRGARATGKMVAIGASQSTRCQHWEDRHSLLASHLWADRGSGYHDLIN